jgi:hypothetical protein
MVGYQVYQLDDMTLLRFLTCRAVWHNCHNLSPTFLGEGPQTLLQVGSRTALVKITKNEIHIRLNFCAINVYLYM